MNTLPEASKFPVFAAALAVVIRRLTHAHDAGGLLEGMKSLQKSGKGFPSLAKMSPAETIAARDLPCVRVRNFQAQAATGHPLESRALREGSPALNMDSARVYLQTMQISVLASAECGFMNMDPDNPNSGNLGVYDWACRVLDVIETSDSGTADASLDRASCQPISCQMELVDAGSENYLEVVLQITSWSKPLYRAQHTCPLGT
jgi:hypothetical protein